MSAIVDVLTNQQKCKCLPSQTFGYCWFDVEISVLTFQLDLNVKKMVLTFNLIFGGCWHRSGVIIGDTVSYSYLIGCEV